MACAIPSFIENCHVLSNDQVYELDGRGYGLNYRLVSLVFLKRSCTKRIGQGSTVRCQNL
jgi:hypothetical protein